MIALLQEPLLFMPRFAPPRGAEPELGRAFARLWHERSERAERELCEATTDLVNRFKESGLPIEEAVVAFKTAIRHYGGMRSFPTLVAEEHSIDGEECAVTYERAFACFIETYFGAT